MSRSGWDEVEVRATVEDYFAMLDNDLNHRPYNKSEHRRRLSRTLSGRTDAAIERKHMNISAVLREAGFPFLDGYKPLGNYQILLADVVRDRLRTAQPLQLAAERISAFVPDKADILRFATTDREIPRPESVLRRESPEYRGWVQPRIGVDFTVRDANNRKLGELGERFILEIERTRLAAFGRKDLAKAVSWISKDIGDGLGYDIRSFSPDGGELFIEVKSTNLHRLFPFIVTRNEVRVSETKEARYRLCRVFNLSSDPKFFVLPGAISSSCRLDARTYDARI